MSDNNLQDSSFFGTGWTFPPSFQKETAGVEMVSDLSDIEESLQILLSTRPGERIMQPDYGCNLDRLMFEPMDTSLKSYVEDVVKTAILYHEPRIEPLSVQIDTSDEIEGWLNVIVEYSVRTTNSRYNFVYPFYKDSAR
jgi:hypothetical protein